ncbi:MAG: hypothetical protein ACJAYU_005412 [Bradymonadia bacterium]|jgi:hypothetical protein
MRLLCVALIAAALVHLPANATAEEETAPNWTITVDPLTTALGFVHLQVERRLGEHLSLYAGPNLRLFTSPILGDDPDDEVRGYGAELGLRYFFQADALEGWWAMLRGVGASITDGETTEFGAYGGVLAGYTRIHNGWLVLSGGAGIQYLSYSIDGHGPEGVAPALHTNIGVAF